MEYSNLTLRVTKSLKMRILELVFDRKKRESQMQPKINV